MKSEEGERKREVQKKGNDAFIATSSLHLRITGGEEDGVNNEDANPEDLYSKPEETTFCFWEQPLGRFHPIFLKTSNGKLQ